MFSVQPYGLASKSSKRIQGLVYRLYYAAGTFGSPTWRVVARAAAGETNGNGGSRGGVSCVGAMYGRGSFTLPIAIRDCGGGLESWCSLRYGARCPVFVCFGEGSANLCPRVGVVPLLDDVLQCCVDHCLFMTSDEG